MVNPSATTSIKIEARPAVTSSVAISRPNGPTSLGSPGPSPVGASASIAAAIPIGGVGASASLLPTIFSLPLGGAGPAHAQTAQPMLSSASATAGMHAAPKVTLPQSQILPPPQLQQQSGAVNNNTRSLSASFSGSSIGAGGNGGGSIFHNIAGGSMTLHSGASPLASPSTPQAATWQCSHSLLFVGNSRCPEDMVATQLTVRAYYNSSSILMALAVHLRLMSL